MGPGAFFLGGGRWPKHGGKAPEVFHTPPEAEAEKEGDSASPEEAAQDPALRFRAQNLAFLSGKSFIHLCCVLLCVVLLLLWSGVLFDFFVKFPRFVLLYKMVKH